MVTRREVWELLGGLDEQLAVSYNDVDFCLRAAQHGWKTVWTPFAELIHYESTSRKPDIDPANTVRARAEFDFMVKRWSDVLRNDPSYNPNLTLDHEDYGLSWPPRIGPVEARRRPHPSRDGASRAGSRSPETITSPFAYGDGGLCRSVDLLEATNFETALVRVGAGNDPDVGLVDEHR